MDVKLYVGNLAYSTTEEVLRDLFAQVGTVASVALIKDRDSGRSKGFAFVEMSNQVEAQNAIAKFNGYSLDGRELKISIARPREERPRGGYSDRGGYGNRGGGYGNRGGGDRRGGGGGQRRY